jgi:hypothetical protein
MPMYYGPFGPDTVVSLPYATTARSQVVYRPQYHATQGRHGDARDWILYDARRSRYAVQWGHYEGNVFEEINSWHEDLKVDKALYEFIRTIYSPANRLGEFWATHIFGGPLDSDAGAGDPIPSAIPIITSSDALRGGIARLWADSQWQQNKEQPPRFGSIMGDVALTIEDDPDRRKVMIRTVDPRTVVDVMEDTAGNCRGYVVCEMRIDPRYDYGYYSASSPPPYVEYKEVCYRQGTDVVYKTFLDGLPFDWRSRDRNGREPKGATWVEEYGFVPFVRIQHKNIGLGWGVGELWGQLNRLYELDDQASKFGDYVRNAVDATWLMAGVNADYLDENKNDRMEKPGDTKDRGRERSSIIYTQEPNARAQALVAPLDLPAVMQNIQNLLAIIEREHPELTVDQALASGDASGKALRVARQKAEALVTQRRATYDSAMARIHQMAISIAAQKGYPGYETFDAGSYARGELDHTIGPRPVFALNDFDRLEVEKERSTVIEVLRKGGMPLATSMQRAGYTEPEIKESMSALKDEQEMLLEQIKIRQATAAADGASYGGNPGVIQQ